MQSTAVKRNGLADQVIDRLRGLITKGAYKVGDRLPTEADLSSLFRVGRSTIREAMRVLSNRGIVNVKHGDGTFVASKAHASFEERLERSLLADIYEARLALEMALSELAARRRTAREVTAMRRYLKQREQAAYAGDVQRYADADFAFHLEVAKAAKSPALFGVYESFIQTVRPQLINATDTNYVRSEKDTLHAELCDAIAAGDLAETRRLVRRHLERSRKDIANRLRTRHE